MKINENYDDTDPEDVMYTKIANCACVDGYMKRRHFMVLEHLKEKKLKKEKDLQYTTSQDSSQYSSYDYLHDSMYDTVHYTQYDSQYDPQHQPQLFFQHAFDGLKLY